MKENTISACMIVRDEEKFLVQCLESIKDLVDEICIVDTGSVDKTVEIAKSFGAQVRISPWREDFSFHRNESIDMATGEWVFIIDADEQLHQDSRPIFRANFLELKQENIIWMGVWSHHENSSPHHIPSIRGWKKSIGMKYEGIVHNQLIVPINTWHHRSKLKLNHYGYILDKEAGEKKKTRTKLLLEKQLKENPNNAFALYNYAQLHRSKEGKFNTAEAKSMMNTAVKAFILTDPVNMPGFHIHLQSLDLAAWSALHCGRINEAIKWGERAVTLKPDYLDSIFLLGHAYQTKGDFEAAVRWFEKYEIVNAGYEPTEDASMVAMEYINRLDDAYHGIAHSSEKLGDIDKAINYFMLALRTKPGKRGSWERLYRLFLSGELHEREWKICQKFAPKQIIYESEKSASFQLKDKVKEWTLTATPKRILELTKNQDINGEDYDTIIALDLFDYIDDYELIEQIPTGKKVIFSVSAIRKLGKIRECISPDYIKFRYRGILDIKTIRKFNNGDGDIFLCDSVRLKLNDKAEKVTQRNKIAFFATNPIFVNDIMKDLGMCNEVKVFKGGSIDDIATMLQWADLAWFEWCDDLIIAATQLPKTCKAICRLHRYEVFTDMPGRVDWSKIDKLLFVNDTVKELFEKGSKSNVSTAVIHNGVDPFRFTIPKNKKAGKKIASVGHINYKKNPSLLLYCFKKIHEYDPEYSLHIAGDHQDAQVEFYFNHFLKENPLPVYFDDWVDDMPAWYADKDFIISTSLFESFHYSVAEGMMSGLLPLIHNWHGAKDLYPAKYCFEGSEDCLELLKTLEQSQRKELQKENRDFILSNYNLTDKLNEISDMVHEILWLDKPKETDDGENTRKNEVRREVLQSA